MKLLPSHFSKILPIILVLLVSGCSKDSTDITSIIGKWQLFEQTISTGGPAMTESVQNGAIYDFKQNNAYTYESRDTDAQGTWEVSEEILMLNQSAPDIQSFTLFYTLENGVLTLSPPCIEACSSKYRRI